MERDGSHQNHDERLTEDGARGEREARNWYYSAETWRHENSNLWDQPEEAKVRLWNGDQPKWQIARRDHDNLNRSWAAVGETWQSALRGWHRLKDFGRETKFGLEAYSPGMALLPTAMELRCTDMEECQIEFATHLESL
ncbi:uncharacterized protein BDW43DRAFT_282896 [Aspergillus alliaceus]|uniref:uncharacterized protein n=1 Tax=Petromyces alliaceus TaxID=209559 RepID=UPI0012A5CE7C|nr:uncharacterized protein BDW43DRAFT_282896 [Aspergillus alliaceus]KAB8231133.1 hypothetical protein BDW43DRAFT_282896 [Aspergillus alliaceus]